MSENLSSNERIKIESDGLRGTIAESLQDEFTGAIREDDQALIKFHGMYQQDDRDRREERAEKKLDRLYCFMIRLDYLAVFLHQPNGLPYIILLEKIQQVLLKSQRDKPYNCMAFLNQK